MTSTSTAFLQRIWHSRPALAQSGENNIVSSLAHAAVQLRRISAARENADENTQITTNNANFLKLAPGPLSKASFLDVPSLNGGGCLPLGPDAFRIIDAATACWLAVSATRRSTWHAGKVHRVLMRMRTAIGVCVAATRAGPPVDFSWRGSLAASEGCSGFGVCDQAAAI
jgi:hypothetical protein